jgi:hypothetical protein
MALAAYSNTGTINRAPAVSDRDQLGFKPGSKKSSQISPLCIKIQVTINTYKIARNLLFALYLASTSLPIELSQ